MESMVRQSGADERAARGPPDAMASQRARGTHVMRTGAASGSDRYCLGSGATAKQPQDAFLCRGTRG